MKMRPYLLSCILLLYEAKCVVALPLFKSESERAGMSEEISNPSQNPINIPLVMPVWARKAGGNWRPELLGENNQDNDSPVAEETQSEPDRGEGILEMTPKEAVKVGERMPITTTEENKIKMGAGEEHLREDENMKPGDEKDNYDYEYDLWGEEEPEPECPDDMFYHIRGKRCVPVHCPGGNQWRDQMTGECILKRYGYRNRQRYSYRQWRPYRRTFFGGGRGSFAILLG